MYGILNQMIGDKKENKCVLMAMCLLIRKRQGVCKARRRIDVRGAGLYARGKEFVRRGAV